MTYAIDATTPDAGMKAALRALTNPIDAPVPITAGGVLDTATYDGKLAYVTASGVALTLPTAPLAAAQQETRLVLNLSGGNITVNGVTVGDQKAIQIVSANGAWRRLEPQVTSAGGGGITFPAWISGRTYSNYEGALVNGAKCQIGEAYYMPHFQPVNATISAVNPYVAVAGAAGEVGYCAIYACDASLNPTTVLATSNSVTVDSTGAKSATLTSSLAMMAGTVYMVAFATNSAAGMFLRVPENNASLGNVGQSLFGSAFGGLGQVGKIKTSGITPGTWPASPTVAADSAALHFAPSLLVA